MGKLADLQKTYKKTHRNRLVKNKSDRRGEKGSAADEKGKGGDTNISVLTS